MRKLLVGFLCAVMVMMLMPAGAILAQENVAQATAFTESNGQHGYTIKLRHDGTVTQVASVSVPHINSYTVPVFTDNKGKSLAYIANYDGIYGDALHLVSNNFKEDRTVATGRIMGAQWSPDGSSLAYLTFPVTAGENNLWLLDPNGTTVALGHVPDATGVIGWSSDKKTLLVTRTQETPGLGAEKLSGFTVTSGEVRDLFVSDPTARRFYVGFQMVPAKNREVAVSFLVTSTLVGAASRENAIAVGTLNGTIVHELPAVRDRIVQWSWDEDLSSVAYVVSNVDENPEGTGIWVADTATGGPPVRLTQDVNLSYKLMKWDGKKLTLGNARFGLAEVDRVKPSLPKERTDVSTMAISLTATNWYAPYVHQVYDTPTQIDVSGQLYPYMNGDPSRFSANDGGKQDACGPTSAIMIAGAMAYVPSRSTLIPAQDNKGKGVVAAHYNSYGWYIPSRFTSTITNYTFSAWDYSSSLRLYGMGAHGATVVAGSGSSRSALTSFMQNLSQTSRTTTWNGVDPAETWARTQLSNGRLILMNVQYQPGWGHWIVLKGYDPENGYYIANDPYGQYVIGGSWGLYDGADAKYGWQTMNLKVDGGMVAYW